ncbi:lysozyme C, tracheal isozyme-like [Scyliorhinus canicula]|uniref:lysozyme C, tracheal isozyme-like n=1 Tax=Scyliorhinus canicula TaxID=7830 RepID=UPI0018F348BB|nr:lysozyme C, tracheal isozyme-like [Scyliorhinus canicula]
MKTLIVLSVLLAVTSAEILTRCQTAKAIKNSVLAKYTKYSVADWVCLIKHASNYNTLAVGHDSKDGKSFSTNYGLFQISSKWWCNNGKTPNSSNGCGIQCTDLMSDNLKASIDCASIIVAQKGMEAWSSWVENCMGKWINYYSYFCYL